MADTPRTLATLLTLCADNATGDITAQVLRDALVSAFPARGQLSLTGTTATTFLQSGTYVPVLGTTALDATVSTGVTMPANGTLRFDKTVAQVVQLTARLAVLPGGNNHNFTFAIAKGGTAITSTAVTAQYGNLSGNPETVILHALVPVVAGDTLSVVVRNNTDTTQITASALSLSAIAFTT